MNRTRATRFLTLSLSLFAAAGCPGNGPSRGDAGTSDASLPADAAQPLADAAIECGPDASAPDAAPPARALVPMHLLGGSPLDNRLLDPDLNDLYTWFLYALPGYSTPTHHRPVLAQSPASLPVLEIDEASAPSGVNASTYAFGGQGPFTASVWLGQPAASSKPLTLSAQVVGLDEAGTAVGATSFDLAADVSTRQTLGDIRWTQFTGRIDAGLLGWAFFTVSDTSGSTLYVTGAVLVEDKTLLHVERRPGRLLSAPERETLKHLIADVRRRLPSGGRRLGEPKSWPVPP